MTPITNDELEQLGLNFSRCANHVVAPLTRSRQHGRWRSVSVSFMIISSVPRLTSVFFVGVSYRKGLNLERQSTGREAMLIVAVDEEAVTKSVALLSDRSP